MATTTLQYRLATPADAPQVQQLVESAFRTEDTRPDWTGDTTLSSNFRIDINGILSKITTPNSAFLIATDTDSNLVACIGISRRSDDAALARFFMLAVDDAYQRAGIGRKVLAYAEEYCQSVWGVKRGGLNALSTRKELILWYMRCGYQRTGELTPFLFEYFKGIALPEDLCFVEMEKELSCGSGAD
jgi:GNAT superfamily N-acetyltransferase